LVASDGAEALEIVHAERVHLLLLDMHMPRLTGLETLSLVKQFRAMLPCIMISADADEAMVQQALRLRAFSVLSKPISRLRIISTVEGALRIAYNWPKSE
jgi:CheY-like chemotaxis protein